MAKYSVPARLIGRPVRVSLRASEVVIFDWRTEVARHDRVVARGGEAILLDNYLEARLHAGGATLHRHPAVHFAGGRNGVPGQMLQNVTTVALQRPLSRGGLLLLILEGWP